MTNRNNCCHFVVDWCLPSRCLRYGHRCLPPPLPPLAVDAKSLKNLNQTNFSQELVLKYESWKVLQEIVPYEFLSSTPQSNREILFRNKFSIPLCLSNENCKRPRRNHTPKRKNCFAIFILACNFHISMQFSNQFAILTFWCMIPTWTFAIFIWVCNFHMSLQFSYQFPILTSQLQHFLPTRLHTDSHVTMNLNL
jgi:hypothetical protein